VTNFGALAILALPRKRAKMLTPDEADLRLLLALETFTEDASGWRSVGMEKLARSAGVPYGTARRSCDRLVAAGLVARESGNGSGRGKGTYTRWRLLFPLKVPSQGEHLKDKVPTQGEHLNSVIRCSPEPVKVLTQARKGAHLDSLTSGDAGPALGSFALGTSALSPGAAPDTVNGDREREDRLTELLREAVPSATPEEVEHAVGNIQVAEYRGEIRSAVAWLREVIKNGDAAALIDKVRYEITAGKREAVAALRPHSVSFHNLCKRCGQADHATPECPT
jgi:hypothetical protein